MCVLLSLYLSQSTCVRYWLWPTLRYIRLQNSFAIDRTSIESKFELSSVWQLPSSLSPPPPPLPHYSNAATLHWIGFRPCNATQPKRKRVGSDNALDTRAAIAACSVVVVVVAADAGVAAAIAVVVVVGAAALPPPAGCVAFFTFAFNSQSRQGTHKRDRQTHTHTQTNIQETRHSNASCILGMFSYTL